MKQMPRRQILFKCNHRSLKKRKRERSEVFGSFSVRDRKSIRARNPKSGNSIELPKRSYSTLELQNFKQRVN